MIEGLKPRDPIGAVLTVGRKGPSGAPVETDRFFFVLPQEVDGVRPLHPAFASFNKAEAERRTVIKGNLIHQTAEEAHELKLKAQILPNHQPHPSRAPACVGCGVGKANRWLDGAYKEVPCPGPRCEFQQPQGKRPAPCRPFGRLLFRPRWDIPGLPTPLTKLTTGSWNTASSILGFFEYIAKQAHSLGVSDYSLYGLPFSITLSKKKRRDDAGGRAFPVMSIAPEGDILEMLHAQRKRVAELGAPPPVAALTDREQQSPEEQGADGRSHAGPIVDVSVPRSSS